MRNRTAHLLVTLMSVLILMVTITARGNTLSTSIEGGETKRFNVRTSPVSALIGVYSASLDIGILDNLTVGPTYSYIDYDDDKTDVKGQAYGVRANMFLSGHRLDGGWYFGPSVTRYEAAADVIKNGSPGKTSGSFNSYSGVLGYQWMWDSFNINVGAGATYIDIADPVDIVYNDGRSERIVEVSSGVTYSGELSLGFAF